MHPPLHFHCRTRFKVFSGLCVQVHCLPVEVVLLRTRLFVQIVGEASCRGRLGEIDHIAAMRGQMQRRQSLQNCAVCRSSTAISGKETNDSFPRNVLNLQYQFGMMRRSRIPFPWTRLCSHSLLLHWGLGWCGRVLQRLLFGRNDDVVGFVAAPEGAHAAPERSERGQAVGERELGRLVLARALVAHLLLAPQMASARVTRQRSKQENGVKKLCISLENWTNEKEDQR